MKTSKKIAPADREPLTDTQKSIVSLCDAVKDLLLYKNRKYGDSAIHPKHLFYKGGSADSILIRLDDKLGRIVNNSEPPRTNDMADLIGYEILYMVSQGITSDDIAAFKD